MELEFIQCLSNPHYLNWLAQNRTLEEPAFVNYLKYLEYWRKPEYSCYILYPHCLHLLELLQHKEFRETITQGGFKEEVHTQQFYFWQHYRANRIKECVESKEKKAPNNVERTA